MYFPTRYQTTLDKNTHSVVFNDGEGKVEIYLNRRVDEVGIRFEVPGPDGEEFTTPILVEADVFIKALKDAKII